MLWLGCDPSHIALCLAYLDKTSSIRKSAIFIRVSLAVHFFTKLQFSATTYLIVHNVNLYTRSTRRALCTVVLSLFLYILELYTSHVFPSGLGQILARCVIRSIHRQLLRVMQERSHSYNVSGICIRQKLNMLIIS